MSISDKIVSTNWVVDLVAIGKELKALAHNQGRPHEVDDKENAFSTVMQQACAENPWFTLENIRSALNGLAHMLREASVQLWAEQNGHLPKRYTGKRVGIIAAGNIPMVAFHDILCTLVVGHTAVVKLSAQDQRLLPALFALLEEQLHTHFEIEWVDGRLPEIHAMIATGSNNTARYFEYYFGKYPNIIRKNRNAVAIIDGSETKEQLELLGRDIFSYFGLGCRNVAKLYVHDDFKLEHLFEAIYPHHDIVNHHKYANNYDYYKALWLMNREELLDNNFLLLRPSEALASPVGVLYYERFNDKAALRQKLHELNDQIQCIVSVQDVPFGKSQEPELWDYADGVDTMKFLRQL